MIPYHSVVRRRLLTYLGSMILVACGARSPLQSLAGSSTGGVLRFSGGGASGTGGVTTAFNGGATAAGGTTVATGGNSACGPWLTTCEANLQQSCIDLQSNTTHCGACGHACKSGWHCTAGECRSPACEGKFTFGPRLVDFQYGSSSQLGSIAAADFDEDGQLDLAVTDFANGVVGVRLGEGQGRFGTAAFYPTGDSPGHLRVADFNADGDLDLLAVGTSSAGTASVFLGDGHGAFAPKRELTVGQQVYQLAVGDINGDRAPDLVATSYPGPALKVLLGSGDGTFAPGGDYLLREHIDAVAMVDLDGDQRFDVVALNWEGSSTWYDGWVSVLLGNADGSLTRSTDHRLDIYCYDLAIGDVNNDGAADVLAAGEPSFEVLFGDGHGGFRSSLTADGGGRLTLGDLDDDGNLDAVALNEDVLPTIASTMRGNGDGSFTSGTSVSFGINALPVLGDFDGDGNADMVGITSDQRNVTVLSGKGDGTFVDAVSIPDEDCPQTAALGDVNRDGNLDLLSATSSRSVRFYFGTPDNSTAPTMSLDVGGTPAQVLTADIDADNVTDLMFGYDDGTIGVRFGTGTATWGEPVYVPSTGLQPITLADMDNDGLLDLLRLVPWSYGYALSSWRNLGGRAFSPPSTYPARTNLAAFAVGDFDGDQLPDLVLAPASANVEIALAMVAGSFASPVEYQTPSPLDQLRVADVTGDGMLDVIGHNADASAIVLLPGRGDGSLGSGRVYPIDEPCESLSVYDVDGDRNLDIVTVGWNGAILMKGNGRGEFAISLVSSAMSMPPHFFDSPAIGDLNGDGWPDLVVTSSCTTDVMFGQCR